MFLKRIKNRKSFSYKNANRAERCVFLRFRKLVQTERNKACFNC